MTSGSVQPWRYLYRGPLLLLHVLVGIPLALIAFLPGIRRVRIGPCTLQVHAHRLWCIGMMRVCGIRPVASGPPLPRGAALLVANHISWIDILLLHGVYPARFVAKQEISRWPLVGVLAGIVGTIYIQRGNADSRQRAQRRIAAFLRRGDKVAIFPEGGINPNPGVGRFHGRLMAAAIRTGAPLVPVALKYVRDRDLHDLVVFGPGENFVQNLLRIMGQPPFKGLVVFGEQIPAVAGRRSDLARRSQQSVSNLYGL